MLTQPYRYAILIGISLLIIAAMFSHTAIPQDPAFHHFVDSRSLGSLPNFANVASNLLFLLVGAVGLWRSRRIAPARARPAYICLCLGVALVSAGSGWYHLAPDNLALIWDRMPIAIAFMALFSMLLHERVLPANAPATLLPLLSMGLLAAAWWWWTERQGVGDLRAYALVQFLPIVLMPLILKLFPSQYLIDAWLWRALLLYGAAKLAEHFDAALFDCLQLISGHTLKHALAAAAAWCIIRALPQPAAR